MLSARAFLLRGLLAGLIAGVAAFAVAYVGGEPSIRSAIALEESAPAPADHSHEEPGTEVPRALQSTVGLLTGTVVAGSTLGGLVGVLSALALGRLGGLSPRASTLSVTAIGFVAVFLVPFVAYPPNPPAVGSGETIGLRTALYFSTMAIGVVAAVVAVLTGRRLAGRIGGWYAAVAAAGGFVAVVGVAVALLPVVDEVPADFPATVLYAFRMASLATQLALWSVLGVVLAELVHRLTAGAQTSGRRLTTAGRG